MNDFLTYLIKFSILFAVLIGFYHWVLRKETLHYFKRMYLLLTPFLAALLPLLSFQTVSDSKIYEYTRPITLINSNVNTVVNEGAKINGQEALMLFILLGATLYFLYTLLGVKRVFDFIRSCNKKPLDIGVLCDAQKPTSPFSFFQFIVLRSIDHEEEELNQIIEHEQVHVYQRHFVDMLIAQLVNIFFWWNPLTWFYRHFVVENLEFIVDQEVLRSGIDKKRYQFSILKTSVYDTSMVFANHFNQSLIKKRIEMMNKQLSNPKNLWRTVFVVPLLLLLWIGVGQIRAENLAQNNTVASNNVEEHLHDLGKYWDDPETQFYLNGQRISLEEAQLYNLSVDSEKFNKVLELRRDKSIPSNFCVNTETDENGKKSVWIEANSNDIKEDFENFKKDSLPDDVKIYIGDKLISKQKLQEINPDNIANVNVIKNDGRKEIHIQLKSENASLQMEESNIPSDTQIFLDNKRITSEELDRLDKDNIASINVKKEGEEKAIYVYTKSAVVRDTLPNKIYDFAETAPEYPGGINTLRMEVQRNYNIPEIAKKNDLSGQIVTRFVVGLQGQVEQIQVLKGIKGCEECSQEAKRAIGSLSQRFTPGKQDGKPVRVRYTLPIVVKIGKGNYNSDIPPPPPPPPPSPPISNKDYNAKEMLSSWLNPKNTFFIDGEKATYQEMYDLIERQGKLYRYSRADGDYSNIPGRTVNYWTNDSPPSPPPPPPPPPPLKLDEVLNPENTFLMDGVEVDYKTAKAYYDQHGGFKNFNVNVSELNESGKATVRIYSKNYSEFTKEEMAEMKRLGESPVPPPPPPPPPPVKIDKLINPNNQFSIDNKKVSYEEAKKYFSDTGSHSNRLFFNRSELSEKGHTWVTILSKDWNEYTNSEKEILKSFWDSISNSSPPPPPPMKKSDIIFDFVEVAPEYPGGMGVLRAEVQSNYQIPEIAKQNALSGTIVLRFVVGKDGRVEQAEVLKGINGCEECSENAINAVMNLSEAFSPGTQAGKPVRVRYTLPIVQKLNKKKKKKN